MKPIQLALLGAGTVAGGVCHVLQRNQAEIQRRAGRGIEIAAVAARDLARARQALGTEASPQAPSTAASLPSTASRGSLLVQGTSNVLTKIAGCCRPAAGEPIGGYVTAQGGGISIHRRDCKNLERLAMLRPHKLVEVAWGESRQRRAARRMERKTDAD